MRPKKVVWMVDASEQALSLRSFLLETLGYRVEKFTSPAAALTALANAGPGSVDLLISDLLMPEMDGNELVLRAKQLHPGLPTMILSGTVESYDRANAADVFLPKSICFPAEILERVRILVARKRGPKGLRPVLDALPRVKDQTAATEKAVA
jgi:CheY-like chemotaxis protein